MKRSLNCHADNDFIGEKYFYFYLWFFPFSPIQTLIVSIILVLPRDTLYPWSQNIRYEVPQNQSNALAYCMAWHCLQCCPRLEGPFTPGDDKLVLVHHKASDLAVNSGFSNTCFSSHHQQSLRGNWVQKSLVVEKKARGCQEHHHSSSLTATYPVRPSICQTPGWGSRRPYQLRRVSEREAFLVHWSLHCNTSTSTSRNHTATIY